MRVLLRPRAWCSRAIHRECSNLRDQWARPLLRAACRAFPVPAHSIDILGEPRQFYDAIIDGIRQSRDRITLAALYLGTGELERSVVRELHAACVRHPNLEVHVLFDHSRGTRGRERSTASLFQPLVAEFPARVRASFFLMPQLRGPFAARLPSRYNEGVAVQHVKAYAFDDSLVLGGANMGRDYFTDRQDRCWRFRRAGALARHFHAFADELAPFSHSVRPGAWQPVAESPDAVGSGPAVLDRLRGLLGRWAGPGAGAASGTTSSATPGTFVHLAASCAPVGVGQDTRVTEALLSAALRRGARVDLATGYFNPTRALGAQLATPALPPQADVRLLTAHPSANGFFTATGSVAGALPLAYSLIERDFVLACSAAGVADRVRMHEWRREGWTFHAKGLWIADAPGGAGGGERPRPILATIGSPNFGRRSAERDLEVQAYVTTDDPDLAERIGEERDALFANAAPVSAATFQHPLRQTSLRGGFTHGHWIEAARRVIAPAM